MNHIGYLQYDGYSLYDLPDGVLKNMLMLQPIGQYFKILQDDIVYIYIDNNCMIHHTCFINAHWDGTPMVIDLRNPRQTHK